MSLNIVVVRRSNHDDEVTQMVINGNHARAYVALDTDPPPTAAVDKSGAKKASRRSHQPIVLSPTCCYARSVVRGHYHGKKKR